MALYTDTDTLIHSVTLLSGGRETPDSWVLLSGSRVRATGVGATWASHAADADVVDGTGRYLAPGFIDIHGHGGGGFSYDEGVDQALRAMDAHLAHGTTRQVLSLVANPIDVLVEQLGTIREAMSRSSRVLGAHLEGPFFSLAHKGAHEPRFICDPTPEKVRALVDAGQGVARQITLAPELPGGLDAVEAFVRGGIPVAVGHTNVDYATALEAFRRGASILTHAFNAMPPLLHRAPGPVVAALDTPSVTIEAIADGVHVHPSVLHVLFECAPERIALVTDAMAAAGAADGDYVLGTLPVYVVDGVARLDSGQIAGSTLTLGRAVQVAVSQVGVSLAEAVQAATLFPARAIGIDDRFGTLEPGKAADAVLLRKDLSVDRVWVDGVLAYQRVDRDAR